MVDDVFKLPQSSYETVCRIIQAYAQVGDKTSLATVSKILGHDTTVISRNVGFLVSVGLLAGGRDKGPTPPGIRLGRALEFHETEDIASVWREVLVGHTLIQRILSAIRVRGGMDASTLQGQIVYTAGVKKTPGAMTGGGAVLEMMKAANLIIERDGRFIVPSASDTGPVIDTDDEPVDVPAEPAAVPVVQRVIETDATGVAVRVDIRVAVTASVDELPGVGVAIRELLNQLGQADVANVPSETDATVDGKS